MHHLIVGYGYCGFYLADYLLKKKQAVTAISRHLDDAFCLPGLQHVAWDINSPLEWNKPDTILYYLIPPPADGREDYLLGQFLHNCRFTPAKIIYFGSSAVYGDHQGAWVNEEARCNLEHSKQYRRLDAEQKWQEFCQKKAIDYALLRIGGIYGPSRLPVQNAIDQVPIIFPDQAPYINHIYVKDLVKIAALLVEFHGKGIFNVADGQPKKMGTLQTWVGRSMGLSDPPLESFAEAWEKASPAKREFMQTSKRLCITRLRNALLDSLQLMPLEAGVKSIRSP